MTELLVKGIRGSSTGVASVRPAATVGATDPPTNTAATTATALVARMILIGGFIEPLYVNFEAESELREVICLGRFSQALVASLYDT